MAEPREPGFSLQARQSCGEVWEDSCAALGMSLRSEMAGPAGGTEISGVRLRSSIHTRTPAPEWEAGGCFRR